MTALKRRALWYAGAVVLMVLAFFTVEGMLDPSDNPPEPPRPSPTTTGVDGLSTHLIELDGQTHRCVIYYHGGVDCWEVRPAPSPRPSRSS